jgi:hypothetical protein
MWPPFDTIAVKLNDCPIHRYSVGLFRRFFRPMAYRTRDGEAWIASQPAQRLHINEVVAAAPNVVVVTVGRKATAPRQNLSPDIYRISRRLSTSLLAGASFAVVL